MFVRIGGVLVWLAAVLASATLSAFLATISSTIASIVDRIRPSVEGLLHAGLRLEPDALLRHAVRANVRASVAHLRHGSQVIEQLVQQGDLLVVGAEYSLETGIVEFFEGVPSGG